MIFLDIETSNIMSNTEGWDLSKMRISYAGIIDDKDNPTDIWEKDMDKLKQILESTDLIVGYNIFGFDMPVISNYLGPSILELPQLDLMAAAYKAIGFRPKLDSLTSATFGEGKIGNGGDAVKYFHNGEFDKLKKYCMEDVRLTKKLYEFGRDNGYIKYYDKSGFVREAKINWEDGKKVKTPPSDVLTMF